jgi:hypothetical protein
MSDALMALATVDRKQTIAELAQQAANATAELNQVFEEWRNDVRKPDSELWKRGAAWIGVRTTAESELKRIDPKAKLPDRPPVEAELLGLIKSASLRSDPTISYLRSLRPPRMRDLTAQLKEVDTDIAQWHKLFADPKQPPPVSRPQDIGPGRSRLVAFRAHLEPLQRARAEILRKLAALDSEEGNYGRAITAVIERHGRSKTVQAVTKDTPSQKASAEQALATRKASKLATIDPNSNLAGELRKEIETHKTEMAKFVAEHKANLTADAEQLVSKACGGDVEAGRDLLALATGDLRTALDEARANDQQLQGMISLLISEG